MKPFHYLPAVLIMVFFCSCGIDVYVEKNYQGDNCDCQIAEEGEFSSLLECEENCIFECSGKITDIEGNEYKIVTIGDQCWMAENLRVSLYRNGDTIPNIREDDHWRELASGAWCWYNNDPAFDSIYGKIYNGFTIIDIRKICPYGWRVPSAEDWDILDQNVENGGLKEEGFEHWREPNEGATNSSGFAGLPGGRRRGPDGSFADLGFSGVWFELTSRLESDISTRVLKWNDAQLFTGSSPFEKDGACIRCMRDIR